MAKQAFPQKTITMVWDFDKTLTPGYMQQVIFDAYQVDGDQFWQEVRELWPQYQKLGCNMPSKASMYLNHILHYTRTGKFAGLSNDKLKELGGQIEFYPGMPDAMARLKAIPQEPAFQDYDIKLEHYIVSAGLKKLVEGSAVSPYLDGVWGCEFIDSEQQDAVIEHIAYVIDDTTKTRSIFEINKGVNKHSDYSVNDAIDYSQRRVPFEQMIYIADGPSDVPVFSIVKRMGGKTYGVYDPSSKDGDSKVIALQEQLRLHDYGEADYRAGSETANCLEAYVREIAERIKKRTDANVKKTFKRAPTE